MAFIECSIDTSAIRGVENKGVSFEIEKGELVVFRTEAGKSTVLQYLRRMDANDEGRFW